MIHASLITNEFIKKKYGLITCVPCSLLKPLINQSIMDSNLNYISSVSEGEAVGIAVGSTLAGKIGVVMLQNSGLGNIVNPVVSLTNTYRIPVLFIISLRGEPNTNEAIQHKIMGSITHKMLDLINIYHENLNDSQDNITLLIDRINQKMINNNYPSALIIKRGNFHSCELTNKEDNFFKYRGHHYVEMINSNYSLSRKLAIKEISSLFKKDDLVISATGGISRELFSFNDRPENFYMQGSMGTTTAIGFGISIIKPEKSVIILDGDGSLLMRMGSLATVGYYKPSKFLHVVLDNEAYATTGGQVSSSKQTDFAKVAIAAGYKQSVTVDTVELIQEYWKKFYNTPGPSMLHIKINNKTDKKANRPDKSPEEIRDRFMASINGN